MYEPIFSPYPSPLAQLHVCEGYCPFATVQIIPQWPAPLPHYIPTAIPYSILVPYYVPVAVPYPIHAQHIGQCTTHPLVSHIPFAPTSLASDALQLNTSPGSTVSSHTATAGEDLNDTQDVDTVCGANHHSFFTADNISIDNGNSDSSIHPWPDADL